MNPVISATRVDKILSQFSQMYRNDSYISEMVLPVLKVKERSGKFAKYGKENLRAYVGAIYRAPGTRAHTVDYSVSQGDYKCTEKAIEKPVPDEFMQNSDDPYDPKRDTTAVIMDNIWTNQELALATYMSSTGNITQNVTLSGTSKWSDQTNSTPLTNIDTAIQTVRSATSQRPNTMVLAFNVWQALRSHPEIREQLKYTGNGGNSDDAVIAFLKSYFRLENVFVGSALYNSADEGQTDSLTDIWSANCWLLYRNNAPTLMKATFGLTLSDVPRKVDVRRDEDILSDIVRVRYSYDQAVMDASLCYLIKNAV